MSATDQMHGEIREIPQAVAQLLAAGGGSHGCGRVRPCASATPPS